MPSSPTHLYRVPALAGNAAELAVDLVKGTAPKYNAKMNNGTKEVDSVLLTPIMLTKDNVDVVVKDGFYTHEQVYGK